MKGDVIERWMLAKTFNRKKGIMRVELADEITLFNAWRIWKASGGRLTSTGDVLHPGKIDVFIEPVVVNPATLKTERRVIAEGRIRKFPLLMNANQ